MTCRRFLRKGLSGSVPLPEITDAIRAALADGGVAEFYRDDPVGPFPLAFRLLAHRGAVLVAGPDECHLGTFAAVEPAVRHGWEAVDGRARKRAKRARSTRRPNVV